MLSFLRKAAVEYNKNGDVGGIRTIHKEMGEILGKVGYE